MPTRHGLARKLPQERRRLTPDEVPSFRIGIRHIALVMGFKGFAESENEAERCRQIHRHLGDACSRFIYSLLEVNRLMHLVAEQYRMDNTSISSFPYLFRAGCFADSAMSYLGRVIDDAAIITAFATGIMREVSIDGMACLRNRKTLKHPLLAPLHSLFAELAQDDSWWNLGFRRGSGARQLLMHKHHQIEFQISSEPSREPIVKAYICSQYSASDGSNFVDFFEVTHQLLTKLFSWLDRLEILLASILESKYGQAPETAPSLILLPTGYELGKHTLYPEYFPVPLCDGSDPLPWTMNVSPKEIGILIESNRSK